ncbi:MAG: HAD family hydrolase [Candidatus Omnitrophica bacterium]|nr:HAD family hydrolase [Candidatus Omnitrophota bacterium]
MPPKKKQTKYVFIDRDGVINVDPGARTKHGYVIEWKDFHFLPGAPKALKMLADSGYKSIIVTNQQCVGKGHISEESLRSLMLKITKEIKTFGGSVEKVYYCPHLKEENCNCRKPKEGLFLKAKEELNIERFDDKFFIGDSKHDIEAGKKAGLKTILVLSGNSERKNIPAWKTKPDHVCENLLEAVRFIIRSEFKYSQDVS